MNYQQTYDPMQASAMRQQNNAMLAQGIKSGISNIGNIIAKHIEYKKSLAQNKTASEAKAKLYQSVVDSLREAGTDPSNFKELTNAASDIKNNDITVAQFFASIAKPAEAAKEIIVGRKTIADQPADVRGFRQPNGVGAIDSMQQQNQSNVPPPGFTGPMQSNTKVDDFTARLMNEQKTGSYDPMVTAQNTPFAVDNPANDVVDPYTESAKRIVKFNTELMDKGMMPVGSAERMHTQFTELEKEREKTKQAEIKAKQEAIKAEIARIQKTNEESGETLAKLRGEGYKIKDAKTGKQVEINIPDLKENPRAYVVGNENKPSSQPWNFPSGGAGAKETEIDLQDLVRKNLQTVYRQDIITVNMPKVDSFGEPIKDAAGNPILIPTKVPKADYLFKKLVSNRGEWEKYVWDNYPDYAKKFGWVKPAMSTTKGSGF